MKQIAILSDTHGLLRDEVKAELSSADYIIHAGDIGGPEVLQAIEHYGKTYAVRGNNDIGEWAKALPEQLTTEIEQVRFFIAHNKKSVPKDLTNVDVVIYGHSHRYEEEVAGGILWLNPGGCGKRRFRLEITMCRMLAAHGRHSHEKIEILCAASPRD